ncbi:MAG: hypothetical protein WAO98_08220 [Alphaproteobacteria bacterium]
MSQLAIISKHGKWKEGAFYWEHVEPEMVAYALGERNLHHYTSHTGPNQGAETEALVEKILRSLDVDLNALAGFECDWTFDLYPSPLWCDEDLFDVIHETPREDKKVSKAFMKKVADSLLVNQRVTHFMDETKRYLIRCDETKKLINRVHLGLFAVTAGATSAAIINNHVLADSVMGVIFAAESWITSAMHAGRCDEQKRSAIKKLEISAKATVVNEWIAAATQKEFRRVQVIVRGDDHELITIDATPANAPRIHHLVQRALRRPSGIHYNFRVQLVPDNEELGSTAGCLSISSARPPSGSGRTRKSKKEASRPDLAWTPQPVGAN